MIPSGEPGAPPRGAFYQSALLPHPSTPCEAVRSIEVRLVRSSSGGLDLTYAIEGDLRRLRRPAPVPPRHADGLWRHTCLEAFVAPIPGTAYVELNFSPSGEWACYAFERYREGMAAVAGMAAPAITVTADAPAAAGGALWVLRAAVQIGSLSSGAPARVALAAVIEGTDGRLSYWALRHPQGNPDFHHPDGFALRI